MIFHSSVRIELQRGRCGIGTLYRTMECKVVGAPATVAGVVTSWPFLRKRNNQLCLLSIHLSGNADQTKL